MIIDFKTKKLEKTFNSKKALQAEYGKNTRFIMRRMKVFYAASVLAEISHLPPERRHELTGQMKGTFAVDLKHPFRLLFKPAHNPVPLLDDGGIDLHQVNAITILTVEDYHR